MGENSLVPSLKTASFAIGNSYGSKLIVIWFASVGPRHQGSKPSHAPRVAEASTAVCGMLAWIDDTTPKTFGSR